MNGERPAKRSRRVSQSSADSASSAASDCADAVSDMKHELGGELGEIKQALEETTKLVEETGEEVVDAVVQRLEEQDQATRYAIDDGAGKIACMLEDKLDTTNERLRDISGALKELTASINAMHETMRVR